jgi:hypothetical protein
MICKISYMNKGVTRLLNKFTLCLLIMVLGCEKNHISVGDPDKEPDFGSSKGFGTSDDVPEGTPLILPVGITLDNPIYPVNRFDEADCNGKVMDGEHGTDTFVQLCLLFRNGTPNSINVELPPGLFFESENIEVKNGILVRKMEFVVPAQEDFYVVVRAYCVNKNRTIPDLELNFKYKAEILSTYQPMLDLLKKLETKKMKTGNRIHNAIITSHIQNFVWEIAHTGHLDSNNQAILDALEDA